MKSIQRHIVVLAGLLALICCGRAFSIDMGPLSSVLRHADTGAEAAGSLRKGVEDLTPEEEYYIGRAVAAQLLSRYYPVKNRRMTRYLNQVEVNAFAAPGGLVMVTTGLYRLLETEDQLAAVLAHEIAHVNLGHGLAAIQQANLTQAFVLIGKAAASEGLGSDLGALTDVFQASIGNIVERMSVSGYSREQEYAADQYAAELLFLAGRQWQRGVSDDPSAGRRPVDPSREAAPHQPLGREPQSGSGPAFRAVPLAVREVLARNPLRNPSRIARGTPAKKRDFPCSRK